MASLDMNQRAAATEVVTLAPAPETERGHNLFISADARGEPSIAYCNGRTVFIRELADPTKVRVFSDHKVKVNVAKFSPNGRHVASGDSEGNVLIWEILPDRFNLRKTFPINHSIKDIAWSPDNKRIICVGASEGNTFGKPILVDSGNSVGIITGHDKTILSVDFRQQRPFRAVTASEDRGVCFHQGPPFKFMSSNKDHQNFATCVRFSPDGSQFVSASNDMKMFLFDGKTGEKTGKLYKKKSGHKGTIYAVSWTPDGKQILSASADKTCKLWDVETKKVVTSFPFGEDPKRAGLLDMQVSCLAFQDYLISVGLNGAITYLDSANPETPKQVVHGCMSNIKSLDVDRANGVVYTGEINGNVIAWDLKTNLGKWLGGKRIESAVLGVAVNNGAVLTITNDDKIRTHTDGRYAEDKKTPPSALGGHLTALAVANTDSSVSVAVPFFSSLS